MAQVNTTSKQSVAQSVPTKDRLAILRHAAGAQQTIVGNHQGPRHARSQLQLHGPSTQASYPASPARNGTNQPHSQAAANPSQHPPKGQLAKQVNQALRNSIKQRSRTMQTLRLQRKRTWSVELRRVAGAQQLWETTAAKPNAERATNVRQLQWHK